MVKDKDFKKCDQAGFCKRNRAYADSAAAAGSTWAAPYSLHPDTVAFEEERL